MGRTKKADKLKNAQKLARHVEGSPMTAAITGALLKDAPKPPTRDFRVIDADTDRALDGMPSVSLRQAWGRYGTPRWAALQRGDSVWRLATEQEARNPQPWVTVKNVRLEPLGVDVAAARARAEKILQKIRLGKVGSRVRGTEAAASFLVNALRAEISDGARGAEEVLRLLVPELVKMGLPLALPVVIPKPHVRAPDPTHVSAVPGGPLDAADRRKPAIWPTRNAALEMVERLMKQFVALSEKGAAYERHVRVSARATLDLLKDEPRDVEEASK